MYARVALVALVVAAACGGGNDAPAVGAPERIAQVAATIEQTSSLQFQIDVEGPEVQLAEGVILSRLEGTFEAPDEAHTAARVNVLGITASVDLITIGDRAWQKQPLETEYTELEPEQTPFSAAQLFSPGGIPAILRTDIVDVAYEAGDPAELEAFPGEQYDVITGFISGTRIADLTSGLVESDGATITLLVTGSEARRILIVEPGMEPNTWTIDAWAYGGSVDVTAPAGFE